MLRRTLLTVFGFCLTFGLIAQSDIRPASLVAAQQTFSEIDLFSISDTRDANVPEVVESYELFDINPQGISEITSSRKDALFLSVPRAQKKSLELNLVLVDLMTEDHYVIEQPSGNKVKVDPGKHYRGTLDGDPTSVVALSVFEDQVMGLITSSKTGNLVIGKLEDSPKHILYADEQLKDHMSFECATEDNYEPYTDDQIKGHDHGERALSDCVKLYFEVDYDIYLDKGGTTGATNYVTGLYNQVATMFANESINTTMSPLVIWSQTSPYSSTSSSGMLNDFTAYNQGFNGDLAMLLSYQASGGIAYVDGLCSSNPDFSMSFSSINSTYANVPTYSWSVMVVTHEFGHLFGSQHTHACVWNGNNTAIDGCYTTEGSCAQPGLPSGGGTVMSYCHLTSVGINLNLGFGTQPGNVIRSSVTNSNCTDPCSGNGPTCTDGVQNGNETGVDCGGPDCNACPTSCEDNEATLSILLDNYPGETTWTVTNSGGSVLYSGGPYSSAGSTVTVDFCLTDGCYDFNIFDSYGDGICCGYGQGSYSVSDASGVLISGGQFGSSETQNFCVGGSGPTCDDGIQNGNETDVDCGGPDCDACPTCTDGVQNGNETGIDCGGPDCDACDTGGGSEVFAHYFETGWDGWADGGSDCYRYSGGRSYEGNYSIRIRDNSGIKSSMTSSAYNVSSYSGVEVNFYFYPNSMENGEDFFLRYYDGSSWSTVATFVSGSSFSNNQFYVATVPILASNYTMASNAQFRFQCDASSNADRIYIDAVTVTGLSGGSLIDGEIKIRSLGSTAEIADTDIDREMHISPNPAQENITLTIEADSDYSTNMEVLDLMGRTVINKNISLVQGSNMISVDISQMTTGTYFVRTLDDEQEVIIEKFVKVE